MTLFLVTFGFLVAGALGFRSLRRMEDHLPHVPDDVQARIDAVLPRSQEEERWLETREDLKQ